MAATPGHLVGWRGVGSSTRTAPQMSKNATKGQQLL